MRASWLIFAFATGCVWLGFVLHTSGGAPLVLGKYTASYLAFLTLASLCWIGSLYWAWRQRDALAQILRSLAIVTLITTALAVIVLPGVYIYLHNRSLDKTLLEPIGRNAHSFLQYETADDPPVTTPDETLRILSLGGSTTYGPGLDRDQAYPLVLERLLRDQFPNRTIQVLNAGVPWHTSMHSLLRYVARYADWQPHVVIVMHAFNDIFQTSEGPLTSGAFRSDYGHFFGALGRRANPRDRFRDSVDHFLNDNWLLKTWYSDLRSPPLNVEKKTVDLMRALPSFKRNLRALVHRVRQDGGQLILATQPYIYRTDLSPGERANLFYDDYYRNYAMVPTVEEQTVAMRAFNSTIRDLARQENAVLVDLEANLPKTPDFMYDDVHYTARGAERVAAIFAERAPWDAIVSQLVTRSEN